MNQFKEWTSEEIDFLRTHWPTAPKEELCATLNRPFSALECKASRMKIKRIVHPYWTDSERDHLTKIFEYTSEEDLVITFKRSYKTIGAQARKLGLRRPVRFWTKEENLILKTLYPRASRRKLVVSLGRKWNTIVMQAHKVGIRRMGKYSRQGLMVRFENFYIPEPNSGCWLWAGSTRDKRYGAMGANGKKSQAAHRISWELHKGPIPEGLCVLHKCDVPCCVNPNHLFLGTNQDNSDDCRRKNRHQYGENHFRAKLREVDVINIRRDMRIQKEIAASYGVARTTIQNIQNRKNWKHIS